MVHEWRKLMTIAKHRSRRQSKHFDLLYIDISVNAKSDLFRWQEEKDFILLPLFSSSFIFFSEKVDFLITPLVC